MTKTEELIEQIHNEFDTAGDNLYQQAMSIINGTDSELLAKVSQLKRFGFINATEVKSGESRHKQLELSKATARTVELYRRAFPDNKFITEEQVNFICNKYGLVCGPVSLYKGFVPRKNLKEIEKFVTNYNMPMRAMGRRLVVVDNIKFSYQLSEKEKQRITKLIDSIGGHVPYGEEHKSDAYSQTDIVRTWLKNQGVVNFNLINVEGTRSIQPLMICAPKRDMIMDDGTHSLLGNFFKPNSKVTYSTIPDPVVLHPVEDGYIIITKWGEEASDPVLN